MSKVEKIESDLLLMKDKIEGMEIQNEFQNFKTQKLKGTSI